MSIESFAAFVGPKGLGLEELILFTEGNKSKSPYDDPHIIRPITIDNYYERLGLESFTDDLDDIQNGYRIQAKIWHPDRPQNKLHKKKAEKDFDAIHDAYETLKDADKKATYDKKLRAELGEKAKPGNYQEHVGNAQAAARYSRSFVDVKDVDDQLSPEQRRKVDYLDTLVDGGEIFLSGFGEVYMANMGNQCNFCEERIPSRPAILTYKGRSTSLPDIEAHNLLAHGARAMLHNAINSYPEHWDDLLNMAFNRVDHIYSELQIVLPSNQVTGSSGSNGPAKGDLGGRRVIHLPGETE